MAMLKRHLYGISVCMEQRIVFFFNRKNLNTADFVFFDREHFLGRDLPPFATSYAQVTLTDCSSRLAPTGAGAV